MKAIITFFIVLMISGSFSKVQAGGRNAIVKHFQGPAEKVALDAVWKAQNVFAVGVKDDGSSRDGYAQYVCLALPDFGISPGGIAVQIIDVVELKNTGKWKKLGTARCQNF